MNQKLLIRLKPESVEVEIIRVEEPEEAEVEESELDEMWSYVGKKSNPRWLWHAIEGYEPDTCKKLQNDLKGSLTLVFSHINR